jgi:hypothetical protein
MADQASHALKILKSNMRGSPGEPFAHDSMGEPSKKLLCLRQVVAVIGEPKGGVR